MADPATQKALRELEKVLDTIHKGLPLFRFPEPLATYALLAAFDSFFLIDLAMTGDLGIGATQHRKKFEDGLSQSLRWVLKDAGKIDFAPTDDLATLEAGFVFVRHAGDYYNIADFHAMFGRGLLDVSVDLASKTVRFFHPPNKTSQQAIMGFAETVRSLSDPHIVSRPQDFIKQAEQAIPLMRGLNHRLDAGRVVLEQPRQLANPSIIEYCELFRQEFVDIEPGTDLAGFTVEQFQAFWSVLSRWSHSAVQIYLASVGSGIEQHLCMPTQCLPKKEFFDLMAEISGLNESNVMAIAHAPSLGASIAKPDIFLQPLILGATTVMWSTRVVIASRYPRNLLRLMAKMNGASKVVADNIIGEREVPATRRLGLFLADKKQKGWQYGLRRKVAADGEDGEIDYLGWNTRCSEEVLLIEFKATLDVDEINEVDGGTREMLKGQIQLERCMRIIGKLSIDQKKSLYPFVPWEKVGKLYGIVVSSGCEPNEKYNHSKIPGISVAAFCSRIPVRDFVRPSRLVESCRERRWLSHLNDLEPSEEEVKVGPLTYYLPAAYYRLMIPDRLTLNLAQSK